MNQTKSRKSLSDVLAGFPGFRIAREDEARTLSQYANSQYMQVKHFGIGFDRGDDYFALFKAYTREYWVFVALNDDGTYCGMGALTRFDAFIDGVRKKVCYFGDLRIDGKGSRESRKMWREVYQALVEHILNPESEEHCDHIITAVFQENLRALNVFKNKLDRIKYNEVCPYWTLSIFSRMFSKKPKMSVESGIDTLSRQSLAFEKRPAGDSIVVRDVRGEPILGAVVSASARALRVFNLPAGLKMFFKALGVLRGKSYSENLAWTMKNLGYISAGASIDALTAAVQFCFRESDAHLVNVTLTDEAMFKALQKRFPVSKPSSGFLFEVTPVGKTSMLKDVTFEGAYL